MKYLENTYVHVCGRGTRGLPIVHNESDGWHFLDMLYYLNHAGSRRNLFRQLQEERKFEHSPSRFFWPQGWPQREPIVDVVSYQLVNNHHHLLLRNRAEEGVPRFMQKFGIGFAKYYNAKYANVGTLFQGRYHGKLVDSDEYLAYVSVYIQVKNAFDVYPGGIRKALEEFDKAFEWAAHYPFGSLGDYVGLRKSPIIEKGVLGRMFSSPEQYRKFARECILGMNLKEKIGILALD